MRSVGSGSSNVAWRNHAMQEQGGSKGLAEQEDALDQRERSERSSSSVIDSMKHAERQKPQTHENHVDAAQHSKATATAEPLVDASRSGMQHIDRGVNGWMLKLPNPMAMRLSCKACCAAAARKKQWRASLSTF
ncbi:uncharacterized protein MEPE_02227 [Melanopsichium pennsylvanicum]|uniref:Uncharacterized protein n=1 Tax=Melanopsichium pennsylvanicum TaxID=63383 RepID=A0AAJ5C4B6_9BASI|nr:uncharacterized protein MEPE_02227 [Melanopsichium pennsylvanicum]